MISGKYILRGERCLSSFLCPDSMAVQTTVREDLSRIETNSEIKDGFIEGKIPYGLWKKMWSYLLRYYLGKFNIKHLHFKTMS